MQSLATYSLVHCAATTKEAKEVVAECTECVSRWLSGKGVMADGQLTLSKGDRKAAVVAATYDSSDGVLEEWELTEPLEKNTAAEFRTTLQLAQKAEAVHLYLTLKAGYRESTITPELRLDVYPPRVLFDLASVQGASWRFGHMPVGLRPLTFDAGQADMVINWLTDATRPMPVVALSEYEGEVIHPQQTWPAKVAERLFGMALVIRFREDLSWELTRRIGKGNRSRGGMLEIQEVRVPDRCFQAD